ncbi:MAG TPA: N-acetyl-gamma-glutamyl-phosphate reductase, partial [Methylophilaceae bacterium]|nr:N-acetyl-gamma-glutamyl-phosphate reductase [Methylophilaceae bacterium]
MQTTKIKVGIVGGTGYTGVELLRLLAVHPNAELSVITSRGEAGLAVADMFPSLRGHVNLNFTDPAQADLGACDLVFFATPNGIAMQQTRDLLTKGVRVIDLAADFRIQDVAVWEKWYGMSHACADLIADAVYGLPELNRDKIRAAQL